MTEPTNEEFRIKVAELMGLAIYQKQADGKWFCLKNGGWLQIPNYPESLDACVEFEKTLTPDEFEKYISDINDIVWNEPVTDGYIPCAITASARQRCLAFIKATQQRKGHVPPICC